MTRKPRLAPSVGLAAVVFSGLYVLSDVIETVQGRFSDPQLILTLVSEAAIPFVVLGLFVIQRPQIGWLGLAGAVAYAYSYVFFTGTVVYAIANRTKDYSELTSELGASMLVHGAIMVVAGIGFGLAVMRAGVLPRWTGVALAMGVVAVAATQAAPAVVQLIAAGIRAAALAGMGIAAMSGNPNKVDATDISRP
ncbi:hypothetical protein [Mycolicibacterium sp. CR10]|uniref:hypothetical protein n=1 Tax=Mycolicibacterium sp. CR10 TaxID=2562314 RepID=UPI0010C0C05F|nr:hypothetical protein [Mycolicibacterium sp. CR10]